MRADWTHLEARRFQIRGYESKIADRFGWFVWLRGKTTIRALATDGQDANGQTGWEHVSVSVSYSSGRKNVERIPTWEEMCMVKEAFWGPEECVVQFHPPDRNYVNTHKHCLHLWRATEQPFPVPPTIFV